MPESARVTDTHACGNVDTEGCSNVQHNGLAAHGVGHEEAHCCVQAEGSPNVIICNTQQARRGLDSCAGCSCPPHPGTIQSLGSPNVITN